MSRVTIEGIGELEREVRTAPWGEDCRTIYSDPLGTLKAKATHGTLSVTHLATFGFGIAIGAVLGVLV
jgi:hypothetical protein